MLHPGLGIGAAVCIVTSLVPAAPVAAQADLAGSWHGQVVRDGFAWNVILHVAWRDGVPIVRVSFPDWGMFLVEADSVGVTGTELRFTTDWFRSSFLARVSANSLAGNWRFGTRPATVHLSRTSAHAGLLHLEPVAVVADDGARLAGTLILPEGEPPYAGMVLTHGSGPDTRRTWPYVSKAHLAARNGLAVLVYDKRGAGQSTGDGAHEPGRLTADAARMLAYLRADPRIDRHRTGIGGASQGAWVAAELGATDPEIAFVFTVATPGLPGSEQNVFSLETRLTAQGVPPDSVRAAKQALRALYEYYRTGSAANRAEAVALIEAPDPDWSEHELFRRLMFSPGGVVYPTVDPGAWSSMFIDPLSWWREVRVPVIAIWGEEDINVPARYSRDVIEAALRHAGNTHYELYVFPRAGHGVALENLAPGDWPRMAPGYVEAMASWFASQSGRP